MRLRRSFATLLLSSISAAPATPAKPVMPDLLVLGVPHFANHHRDLINSNVEDVRTPSRQREMIEVVSALAALRPNHVAVEWSATKQAALDERYAAYRAGKYVLTADETDQIGLRLAAMLNLAVDGEVEQRSVAQSPLLVEPEANRPDLLLFQRPLRADQSAFVPRSQFMEGRAFDE